MASRICPVPLDTASDRLGRMSDALIDRLRRAIRASGSTPRAISLRAGLSESAVKHILNGDSRSPRLATVRKLAASLNIPVHDLAGEGEQEGVPAMLPGARREPGAASLPIFGALPVASFGRFHLNRQALVSILAPRLLLGWPGAFAIYAPDDAMAPRWKAGEIVLAQPDRPPRDGDHVLAQLEPLRGQPVYAFRQLLRRERDAVHLAAYHADVPPMKTPLQELIRVVDWPELVN